MAPSSTPQRHPLAVAGAALGNFVLRHFGFRTVGRGRPQS
jgi:hypothetical protein